MTGRKNPLAELESLLDRMSHELETDSLGLGHSVPVNVRDEGDTYIVTADLPGYDRENIEVSLVEKTLRIEADRELESETESGEFLRRERHRESVSRSVTLPEAILDTEASAGFDAGVLTIEIPKQQDVDGTSIDIE